MAKLVCTTKRLRRFSNRPSSDHHSCIQIGRPQHLIAFTNYTRVSHPDCPQHWPQQPQLWHWELVYPAPLVSSAVTHGSLDQVEEPKIKYLYTISRDSWPLHLEVVVNWEREEEQVPEEVFKKKRRVQKRKPLLRKSICHANLGDPCPDEQISQVTLHPKQILLHPSHFL